MVTTTPDRDPGPSTARCRRKSGPRTHLDEKGDSWTCARTYPTCLACSPTPDPAPSPQRLRRLRSCGDVENEHMRGARQREPSCRAGVIVFILQCDQRDTGWESEAGQRQADAGSDAPRPRKCVRLHLTRRWGAGRADTAPTRRRLPLRCRRREVPAGGRRRAWRSRRHGSASSRRQRNGPRHSGATTGGSTRSLRAALSQPCRSSLCVRNPDSPKLCCARDSEFDTRRAS